MPQPAHRLSAELEVFDWSLRLIPVLLEIAKWSAGVDPDTDAPPEWIATVERHKPELTAMIVDTVRRGGSVFVGDDSVVAQLAAINDP
jgi:hypothetical protein